MLSSPMPDLRLRAALLFALISAVALGATGCSSWPAVFSPSAKTEEAKTPGSLEKPPALVAQAPAPSAATTQPPAAPPQEPVATPVTTSAANEPTALPAPVAATSQESEPSPPATNAQTAPPTHAIKPGYYINVGLFAIPANGQHALDALAHAHLPAFAEELSTAQGIRTRVRVGPYAHRKQADAAAKKIRALHLEAVVFKK